MLTTLTQTYVNDELVNSLFLTHTYNSDGNMLTTLTQYYTNGQWFNNYLLTHTYNTDGNWLTRTNQRWENNEWSEPIWSRIYTYNSNGDVLTILSEDESMNDRLNTYTYNNNRKTSILLEERYNPEGSWFKSRISQYYYNDNSTLEHVLYQDWENNEWVNSSKMYLTYDINGIELTRATQYWEDNTWFNNEMTISTFDNNYNILTYTYQLGEDTSWVNDRSYTWSYNVYNTVQTQLYQEWVSYSWVNFHLYNYEYDSDNNLTSLIYQEWVNDGWKNRRKCENIFSFGIVNSSAFEWESNNWIGSSSNQWIYIKIRGQDIEMITRGLSATVYYRDFTSIEENNSSLVTHLNSYPNPCQNFINIKIDSPIAYKSCLLSLFDMFGNQVSSNQHNLHTLTSDISIDVSALPCGIYLLNANVDNVILSHKILIVR
ncbi:MAG: T9SS type A sorting domain-containing protein [Bacteroidales bacterium]|nr:T9SS type A sorting domain-containing protein [Bacteroidales bacterium]